MNFRSVWTGRTGRVYLPLLVVTVTGAAVSVGAWKWLHPQAVRPLVYSSAGFGGFAVEDRTPKIVTPIQQASDLYAAGRYVEAEQAAEAIIQKAQGQPLEKGAQHEALMARRILAYSAARQQDFRLARERFEGLRQAAYESADHGRQKTAIGETAPTLEAEGAFEAAVCTGKIEGDKKAEQQFNAFLSRYPDSVLVHAATKRVARYHEGNVPKETEALWKQAMQVQKQEEKQGQREESLCGPQCLAELLKRQGKPAEVSTLAAEMQTSEEGTSLAQWVTAAKRHGLPAKGVALTAKGLQQQKTPLLALIQPGHFVLVEKSTPDRITVWDPDAKGVGQSATLDYPAARWSEIWSGTAVTWR